MQVKLDASNLKKEIDKALHTSLCPISGKDLQGKFIPQVLSVISIW